VHGQEKAPLGIDPEADILRQFYQFIKCHGCLFRMPSNPSLIRNSVYFIPINPVLASIPLLP